MCTCFKGKVSDCSREEPFLSLFGTSLNFWRCEQTIRILSPRFQKGLKWVEVFALPCPPIAVFRSTVPGLREPSNVNTSHHCHQYPFYYHYYPLIFISLSSFISASSSRSHAGYGSFLHHCQSERWVYPGLGLGNNQKL